MKQYSKPEVMISQFTANSFLMLSFQKEGYGDEVFLKDLIW